MIAISLMAAVLLIAWPAVNLFLAGFAVLAATVDDRRRAREQAGHVARHAELIPPEWFWIVVPCLNEERVVGRTVRSALALAAPGAQVRVLVVDDASDDGTPAVLSGVGDHRLHVLRRELPDARKGKGEALNDAFGYISDWAERTGADPTRTVVGIIDGDGRGSDNLLSEISWTMSQPRIGAAQVRVRIHNRNKVLGAVQDLEFGSVADASQILRTRLGSVGLGGNGQFAKLSTLRQLGDTPWSECLVEDLELGLRLHLAGVEVGYVWRAHISQQGVVDVRRLLRQRTRWAQGNLQCARYLPQLFSSPSIRSHTFLEMAYYLLAPWANVAGSVAIAALWIYAGVQIAISDLSGGVAVPGLTSAVWVLAFVAPGLFWGLFHKIRLRDEKLWVCLRAGAVYPLFLLLGLVSTWRAVIRQLRGRSGWVKTERLAEEPTRVPTGGPALPAQAPVSVG